MYTKVYSGTTFICDVITDGANYYLIALCGGIAWGHVGIVMNADEVAEFNRDPSSAERTSRQMCYDFDPFETRAIPEALRAALLAV